MTRQIRKLVAGCLFLALIGLMLLAGCSAPPPPPSPPSKDMLKFTAVTDSSPATSKYMFWRIAQPTYTWALGDTVEYDVFLANDIVGFGGIEIYNTDTSCFRDSNIGITDPTALVWMDQNYTAGHPNKDLSYYAYGTWYHRVLRIPDSMATKTIRDFSLAVEHASVSETYIAYYDNIVIKNSSGDVVCTIYESGDLDPDTSAPMAGVTAYDTSLSKVEAVPATAATEIDDVIKLAATFTAPGGADNSYFHTISQSAPFATYVWQTDDTVEYDVYLEDDQGGLGGIEIFNTDSTSFRDQAGWADQNSISGHIGSDISTHATGQWYHRVLTVPAAMVGKRATRWDLTVGYSPAASVSHNVYYDNIVVKNSSGVIVKYIYVNGDTAKNTPNIPTGSGWTGIITPVDRF